MSQFITAVGVDVSKGKSMVAVRRPGGETVMQPLPPAITKNVRIISFVRLTERTKIIVQRILSERSF